MREGGFTLFIIQASREKTESLAYIHVGNTPLFLVRSQDGADNITQRQGRSKDTSGERKRTYFCHCVF